MKITFRTLHRDLGFFYLGLIITFSISGLFLNHREIWHPLNYEYESNSVTIPDEFRGDQLDRERVIAISEYLHMDDELRRFGTDDNLVWASFKHSDLEFDRVSGEGKLRKFKMTPVLGQMTWLHINTSKYWIYYSDIFALSLLLIAISAMVFPKGKDGFRKYGWKLSLAGVAFPIIIIIILT